MSSRALAAAVAIAALPLSGLAQAPTPLPPPATSPPALPPPAPPPQAAPLPPPAEAPPPATAPQAAPPPAPPPAAAQPPPPPPAAPVVAQKGPSPWRGSFTLGAGTSYGENYFMAGARIGYMLAHGLAAELEGQYWMGASPEIGKLAPGITWYSPHRLYAGIYYARWFVGSGFPDRDAIGGRAGVSVGAKGPASFGLGLAYERTLNCSRDCDAWWPEASVGVSF